MSPASTPRRAARHASTAAPSNWRRFWPGPLTLVLPRSRIARSPTSHRRPRHHRGAGARPSGRARAAGGLRRTDRRAIGQPLRPRVADQRRACARRSARAHRSHPRRRPARSASNRPSSPAPASRAAAARRAAARRDRAGARRGPLTSSAATATTKRRSRPGMLASHYAPSARLRLDADAPQRGRSVARLRSAAPGFAGARCSISRARGDLIEAAANLFSHLRALDAAGASAIAVMPIPHDGLGEAINDRLARAAAPRDDEAIVSDSSHDPLRRAPHLARPARPLRRHRRREYAITDPADIEPI